LADTPSELAMYLELCAILEEPRCGIMIIEEIKGTSFWGFFSSVFSLFSFLLFLFLHLIS
jgi:hypothetical protein